VPNNDPLRPDQSPFRPPEPPPYRTPDWQPSERPPFEPPGTPNPVDPTRNPWQGSGVIGLIIACALVGFCFAGAAHAAAIGGGGGGLPWDTPIQTLKADLTGPTAFGISLIAIVGVFCVMIFGGEINHFVRSLCFVALCVSAVVGVTALVTSLGIAGATIDGGDYLLPHLEQINGVIVAAITFVFFSLGCWLHRRWQAYQQLSEARGRIAKQIRQAAIAGG
jgi:type IV secretory pathway VirB2 component (pilin)